MAYPTPAFTSDDLTDSGTWSEGGSAFANAIDDQHNPLAGIDFDGSNDDIDNGSETYTSGTTATITLWVKTTQTGTDSLMNEYSISTNQKGFYIRLINGAIQASFLNASATFTRSTSSTTLNDGNWHKITVVLRSGSDVDIYIDAMEVSYSENSSTSGGGFTGFETATKSLLIGDNENGSQPYTGIGSRPRLWTEALSSAQVTEEYNDEVAAIGEGFAGASNPGIYPTLFGSIYSSVIPRVF